MSLNRSDWIYIRGQWVPWDEATVHVSAHGLHYGSTAFEGIRAYSTSSGAAVFRLDAHVQRLLDTCKILQMPMEDYPPAELERLCLEAVGRNSLESCYIRPIVYRASGGLGLYPLECPVEVAIFAVEWGSYLGEEAIENGVDAAISSWRRFNSSTASPLGKIGGQYVTSQFVSIEARQNGFAEGILLDDRGLVCEGAGENLFMVKGDRLITPPLASSILGGITRDSVVTLAADLGYEVSFESISRDMLYLADELLMTGTAAEITPVRSVDRIAVGDGRRGPITARLQERFFGIVSGEHPDNHGWLSFVPAPDPVPVAT